MILFKILWNEIKKEFSNTWSYRWQWVGEFISLSVFFFFLSMLTHKAEAGIAYCVWFYSVLIIGDISGKVALEMRTGTFEQIYLSSTSIPILFLSKAITAVFRALLIMVILILFFWFFGYVNFSFFKLNIIYVILLLTPSLFGISLFVGGLTILLKDTGWLINIINNGFLFLSGIFLPLDSFPSNFQRISLLIPTTQAIKVLNLDQIFIEDCIIMLVVNFFYFGFGILCFFVFEKKAKMKGILGHY